jgi:hypothetical protein
LKKWDGVTTTNVKEKEPPGEGITQEFTTTNKNGTCSERCGGTLPNYGYVEVEENHHPVGKGIK